MTFESLLKEWGDITPSLFTMATSGLNSKDKVIAFARRRTASVHTYSLYFRKVTDEELLPAQPYHKIHRTQIEECGISDHDFRDILGNIFDNSKYIQFAYNIPFYMSFLTRELEDIITSTRIYDLSVIYRAVTSKYAFSTEELASFESFYSACAENFTPLPISAICRNVSMSKEAPTGTLPLVHMLDVLTSLYLSFYDQEILQLPS